MKKAATRSTPKAGVKKMSLKDLSAGAKAGSVKGGRVRQTSTSDPISK